MGATSPAASVEKTYRLILQELPAFKTSSRTLNVQVLTRQSVPIFVEPAEATTSGQIETLSVDHSTLAFTVRNTGTRHFIARKIRMTGFDVAGKQLFTHTTVGWYILAGGSRHYELPIHPGTCDLRVEVETGEQTLNRDFNPYSDSCSASSEQGVSRPAKVASVSPGVALPAR